MTLYRTTDIYLAAFLHYKGLELVTVDNTSRRATFIFTDTPERYRIVKSFHDDSATIPPRILREHIRFAKSMMKMKRMNELPPI